MAVTKKLIAQGVIPKNESIVVSITGNGLKTQEAIADRVAQPLIIDARLEVFEELYLKLKEQEDLPKLIIAKKILNQNMPV